MTLCFEFSQEYIDNYYQDEHLSSLFRSFISIMNEGKIERLSEFVTIGNCFFQSNNIWVIDGNIGKSFIIEKFFKQNVIIKEPVEIWENIFVNDNGKNISAFAFFNKYKDEKNVDEIKKRHRFMINYQYLITLSRIFEAIKAFKKYSGETFVMERWFQSDGFQIKILY